MNTVSLIQTFLAQHRTLILLCAILAALLVLTQCAPLSEQIIPSAIGTPTSTPPPTEIPLMPTPMPAEMELSRQQTVNIVLGGSLLVIIIIGGTLYGIRRKR